MADPRYPSLLDVPLHRGRGPVRLSSGIRPQGHRLYRSSNTFEFLERTGIVGRLAEGYRDYG